MSASARHTAASGQPDTSYASQRTAIEQLATDTNVQGYDPGSLNPATPAAPPDADQLLTTSNVQALLERTAAAVNLDNAIIAVVDRNGTILGVRVESGVSPQITGNTANLVFSIDGAVSLARTGAYFANDQGPLTSRTVQEISQTTITQREVQSSPDVTDPNGDSTLAGPGFVAPVGVKGHFPPGIMFTPQVDLYDIESTNRDSYSSITGTRFNVPSQYITAVNNPNIPAGGNLIAPRVVRSGHRDLAHGAVRGIATLPGGVPLYKNGALVGGIGVFFPGTTGFATEENSKLSTPLVRTPHALDLSEVAEYMALLAAGGSKQAGFPLSGPVGNAPALPGFSEPFGRIDLAGITLNLFGGGGAFEGLKNLLNLGNKFPYGNAFDGTNYAVDAAGDTLLPGQAVPYGWLVIPHTSPAATAADPGPSVANIEAIVAQGIAEAYQVRA